MDVLRGDRTWLLWKETGRKRQALKDGKDDSFYSPVLASVTDSLPSVLQSLKASRRENVSSVFLSVWHFAQSRIFSFFLFVCLWKTHSGDQHEMWCEVQNVLQTKGILQVKQVWLFFYRQYLVSQGNERQKLKRRWCRISCTSLVFIIIFSNLSPDAYPALFVRFPVYSYRKCFQGD